MVNFHLYLFDSLTDKDSMLSRIRHMSYYDSHSIKHGTVTIGIEFNGDDQLAIDDTVIFTDITRDTNLVMYYYRVLAENRPVRRIVSGSEPGLNELAPIFKLTEQKGLPKYWIIANSRQLVGPIPYDINTDPTVPVIEDEDAGTFDDTFDSTFD